MRGVVLPLRLRNAEGTRPPVDVRAVRRRQQRRALLHDTVVRKGLQAGALRRPRVRVAEDLARAGSMLLQDVGQTVRRGGGAARRRSQDRLPVGQDQEVVARSAEDVVGVEVELVREPRVVHPLPGVARKRRVELRRRRDVLVLDHRLRRLPQRQRRDGVRARKQVVAVLAMQRVGHGLAGRLRHVVLVALLEVARQVRRPVEAVAGVAARVVLVRGRHQPVAQKLCHMRQVGILRRTDVPPALRRLVVERRPGERRRGHERKVAGDGVVAVSSEGLVVAVARPRQGVPVPAHAQHLLRHGRAWGEEPDVGVRELLKMAEQGGVGEAVGVPVEVVAVQVRPREAVDALVHNHVRVARHDVVTILAGELVVREVQLVVRGEHGSGLCGHKELHHSVVCLVEGVQHVHRHRLKVAEDKHHVLRRELHVLVAHVLLVHHRHVRLQAVADHSVVAAVAHQRVLAAVQLRRVAQGALLRLVRVHVRRQQRQAELQVREPRRRALPHLHKLPHVQVHQRVVHGKVTDKHVVARTAR
eukprot:Rhum_TRINITY_DN14677_c20_g2::Rhum_TRINITY_DN14677_c20_g2_i1::g.109665::m.109665